tara:strand:+ start:95 stop:277 length:183 start_codon:yes stop_codon:yes gene_type:complete
MTEKSKVFEIILTVLDEWEDLQPNMKSQECRRLLAEEITKPLESHIQTLVEEVVCGTIPK